MMFRLVVINLFVELLGQGTTFDALQPSLKFLGLFSFYESMLRSLNTMSH